MYSLKLFLFVLGKLGLCGNFTLNKSRGHTTECHRFLQNSVFLSPFYFGILVLTSTGGKKKNFLVLKLE